MNKGLYIMIALVVILTACTKPKGYGDLSINIGYSVNGKPLITDSLCYTNEVGNEFMITEIQWFLSNIELQDERDDWFRLNHKEVDLPFSYSTDWMFYIDTHISESQILKMAPIPTGRYKAIRFVFGLNENDNQSGVYNNPPESEMFWPDVLGGGYHYMKLNGRFVNNENQQAPLAIHLGIGQNEDRTKFYQNYFTVELPIQFTVAENAENQLDLTMVIDNWFRNPNMIDFNEFGSGIMQNQVAQDLLKANGQNVFRIRKPTETENNMTMNKEDGIVEKFKTLMQKAAPQPHFWTLQNAKERLEELKKDAKM